MSKNKKMGLLGLILAAAITAPRTQAAVMMHDSFESYPIGQLEDNSGNVPAGGLGWAGNWNVLDTARANVQVIDQGLSYAAGGIAINGGSKSMLVANGTALDISAKRPIASPAATPSTVYLRLLYRETARVDPADDFIQIGFDDAAADNPNISLLASKNNTIDPDFGVRFNTSAADTTFLGAGIPLNTTYLLVLKTTRNANGNYVSPVLYVNPTSLIESENPSITKVGTSAITNITDLLIRRARTENGDRWLLDEIAIGESWSAVVPEPASLSIIGLGALGLLRRRR